MDRHYHLIGIGGIGMSGIAKLLLRKGYKVSGSDMKESKMTQELAALGVDIYIGHKSLNINDVDLIIHSSAIKENNPEIQEARRLNITLLRRAEALALLMKDKTVITVAGSHGKTTTTSLASHLLLEAKLFPTVAIGGILRNIDTNAYFGEGDIFVAEADESDGSFLLYDPKYSIITNIDREHLDYYATFESELDAFRRFLNKTKEDGCLFCCVDCPNIRKVIEGYKNTYILFGLDETADIYPKNIEFNGLACEFDCYYKDKFVDRFNLSLGGLHNISNALSVIALGIQLGVDIGVIKKSLATYRGTHRRLDVKFTNSECLIMDDYAHHPTEIKATLEAIRNLKFKRNIVVFQPHRYTRTKFLLDDFGSSFEPADHIIITDIYAAGEDALEGVNALSLCDKVKEHLPDKEVIFLPKEKIVEHLLKIMRPKDLVITLGAGDIIKTCDELVEKIKREN